MYIAIRISHTDSKGVTSVDIIIDLEPVTDYDFRLGISKIHLYRCTKQI